MTEDLENTTLTPTPSPGDGVEQRTRPASEWYREVEAAIAEHSSHRQEIRQQIQAQRQVRAAHNPLGEEHLSARLAHQVAKAQVLGAAWKNARHSLRQAGLNVRSARKQLQQFNLERRLIRERSHPWVYALTKAPYLAWKSRPIQKRLRQATHQRRNALKAIRVMRPIAADPRIRAHVFALTQQLLINDERLSHSIQNLREADHSVSIEISAALRLAPQLRALADQQVTMEQRMDPATQKLSLPKPVQPLIATAPARRRKPGIRIR